MQFLWLLTLFWPKGWPPWSVGDCVADQSSMVMSLLGWGGPCVLGVMDVAFPDLLGWCWQVLWVHAGWPFGCGYGVSLDSHLSLPLFTVLLGTWRVLLCSGPGWGGVGSVSAAALGFHSVDLSAHWSVGELRILWWHVGPTATYCASGSTLWHGLLACNITQKNLKVL